MGTATFGGGTDFYKAWGATDAAATRLVDICRDHGVSLFDTADSYSMGLAERILGEAIRGRRNRLLIWARCATSAVRTSPAGT
ncbi:aldo/keto reductase [Rhodovastum atsumiense]|uniref:aldo/keto reductase n=1 Tax=Rhodovastum atsumiense TaxID=504468 RepID=UPI00202508F2|nr:aldo/keto reductase [Rhodovastum atsumiense]